MVLALLAGAPATAACPPAGRDKAALETLKADGFKLDDKAARESLALGLVACLGDADPVLRDGIGYEALSHWMRAGQFDAGFLRRLRDARRGPSGVGRVDSDGRARLEHSDAPRLL